MSAVFAVLGVRAYGIILLILAVKKSSYVQLALGYFVFLIVVGALLLIVGFGLGVGNFSVIGIGITGSIISAALAKKARITLK